MGSAPTQQTALAVIPKISSVLSLLGSGWIFIEVLFGKIPAHAAGNNHALRQSRRRSSWSPSNEPLKRHHPYHRLLLGMAIYDILESAWNFGSIWPLPADTPSQAAAWLQPVGTTATCSAQGFFLTLGVAIPIYNAFLSLYYLLVINYRFSDDHIRKWIEPSMHLFAFAWAFGTALSSAVMGLFNNANLWCWIAPYPSNCLGDSDVECTRGQHSYLFRWVYYFVPLWLCIFASTVFTLMVYFYVRKIDNKSLQYRCQKSEDSYASSFGGSSRFLITSEDHDTTSRAFRATTITKNTAADEEGSQVFENIDDTQRADNKTTGNSTSNNPAMDTSKNIDRRSTLSKRISFLGVSMRFNPIVPATPPKCDIPNREEEEEEVKEELKSDATACIQQQSTTTATHSDVTEQRKKRFMERWRSRKEQELQETRRRTVEVFHQAVFYLGAFYLTHVWSTSNRIVQHASGGKTIFALTLIHSFFDPFQGFLNFFVYQRPRYLRFRKVSPNIGKWGAVKECLQFTFVSKSEGNRQETGSQSSWFSRLQAASSISRPPNGESSHFASGTEAEAVESRKSALFMLHLDPPVPNYPNDEPSVGREDETMVMQGGDSPTSSEKAKTSPAIECCRSFSESQLTTTDEVDSSGDRGDRSSQQLLEKEQMSNDDINATGRETACLTVDSSSEFDEDAAPVATSVEDRDHDTALKIITASASLSEAFLGPEEDVKSFTLDPVIVEDCLD